MASQELVSWVYQHMVSHGVDPDSANYAVQMMDDGQLSAYYGANSAAASGNVQAAQDFASTAAGYGAAATAISQAISNVIRVARGQQPIAFPPVASVGVQLSSQTILLIVGGLAALLLISKSKK